ncbi:MAG: YidC/Oxa1 family membrane protein insertase [Treponema sp.]|nr:YidC/Oxa1 family membrane protein insertase [Treponema sp.]
MLYNIIISPIELLIDWVFLFISRKFASLGVITAVFGVSLAMNFMALPIYNIADKIQEKERNISKKLSRQIKRIKETFKGDEQFMMIQAYYRENNYHPLYVLRSSLSILIELPFFIAAYHYLSHCDALIGSSFWIFKDLGSADHIFSFNLWNGKVFYVNILPILMTLINFVSGAIYTKEAPAKEKIQLYGVAIVFLALLYNSPSGLVIYWILNNLFSLFKNIVLKMKKPGLFAHAFITVLLFLATFFYFRFMPDTKIWKKEMMLFIALIFAFFPLILKGIKNIEQKYLKLGEDFYKNTKTLSIFIFSSLSLTLLLGFVLPSSLISSSPEEFSFLGNTENPLSYIKNTFFIYFGLCFFWPTVIYFMFGKKVRFYETLLFFSLVICTILNVYVFKANYGFTDALLKIENDLYAVPKLYFVLPLLIFALSLLALLFILKFKKQKFIPLILFAVCFSEFSLSIYKISSIRKEYTQIKIHHNEKIAGEDKEKLEKVFNFSKNKKNVLVIFLDKAISSFFPNILEQFPELNKSFEGFTYYPNTLSFGNHTAFGFPPITGGYDYDQIHMNARSDELLKDKHNEAMLVLPRLFLDKGYEVTYTDPSIPNYKWSGDFTAFKDYPEIKVTELTGKYSKKYEQEKELSGTSNIDQICRTQMVNYCFMEGLYPLLRDIFHKTVRATTEDEDKFIGYLSALYYLPEITSFESEKPTFTFLENDTPHNPVFLSYPDYEKPSKKYKNQTGTYKAINDFDALDYHGNVAALKQVGKYLDFLKENGVYDNTRIILVSDHGYYHVYDKFKSFKGLSPTIPASFNPLFLVKDFNSKGNLKTDEKLMSNADTLFFAKEGLNLSDKNPFTGKTFEQRKDNGITVWQAYNEEGNIVNIRDKTQFTLKQGWTVKDNLFESENWKSVTYDEY